MTDQDRLKAYKTCKERGHQPSDHVLDSNPPWNVCKFCGTWFRFERTLIEENVPSPTETEDGS